jgi:hypothetical protein
LLERKGWSEKEAAERLRKSGAPEFFDAKRVQDLKRKGVPKSGGIHRAVRACFDIKPGTPDFDYLLGKATFPPASNALQPHADARTGLAQASRLGFWTERQSTRDIFSLLSWRNRSTKLIGRDAELQDLLAWAKARDAISIRFLTGPGGAGKTRLAAEVGQHLMEEENWTCRMVVRPQDLDEVCRLPGHLFVALDYPEVIRDDVLAFLSDVASGRIAGATLNLLVLSRRSMVEWVGDIDRTGANPICDPREMRLNLLPLEDSVALFSEAVTNFQRALGFASSPPEKNAVIKWATTDQVNNKKPLFVIASALYWCARQTPDPIPPLGRDVVKLLVRDEVRKLNQAGHRQ